METCDEIENYTFTWGIQGNRWLQTWSNHPDGLGAEWTEAAKQKLLRLNVTRQQALQPLCKLRDRFHQSVKLSQQVEAIYCFFEEIELAERLSDLADTMDASGDNRSAQILNQLWEILLSALEQLHSVLGETVWETDNFTKLFTLLLSQYDVGTIPPVLDAVTAGPISAMRCQEVDHLILLGAEEGLLPSYCGSRGVLTDQERNQLRQMGVPLTGGGMEGLQAEFSEIYGVFCGARETAAVFCGSSQPSFVYRRLCAMAGKETEIDGLVAGADLLDTAAFLVAHDARDTAVSLNIGQAYDTIVQRRNYVLGTVDRESVRKLYGKKLRLSASQVDKQAECRMSYFLRYGLRAKERKEATVDPAEFGTYVHAVLEHTAKRVMEMGGFHQVPLDEVMSIAMGYSDSYIADRFSQLDSERMAYLFKRNVQELAMVVEELWLELSNSAFAPVGFEVAFGDEAQMEAIEIHNAQMDAQLRGFVDRVDIWDNGYTKYFRVVDYKTGRKDFDYCDVFNGIGLQLLLYMFALEDKGDSLLGHYAKPAGVQYFPARISYISASGRMKAEEADTKRGKELKRKGLILNDSDVIRAMEPEGSPKRLSCKTGKDGSLSGDIADREQFRILKNYVFHVLQKLVGDIASGNIDPNPYCRGTSHDACTYCPYKPVCHFAVVTGRRNYKAMTAQRFWEEIGKEMDRHG
jgi:ATP-dependent helicase/nuclease subunit B